MKTRAGWIAAVLLIAVAFLSGPDLLNDRPTATTAAAASAADRDQRTGDELDPPSWSSDRLLLSRRRLPGLPPSPQSHDAMTRHAPATSGAGTAARSRAVAAGRIPHHRDTRSPETLQVFRC